MAVHHCSCSSQGFEGDLTVLQHHSRQPSLLSARPPSLLLLPVLITRHIFFTACHLPPTAMAAHPMRMPITQRPSLRTLAERPMHVAAGGMAARRQRGEFSLKCRDAFCLLTHCPTDALFVAGHPADAGTVHVGNLMHPFDRRLSLRRRRNGDTLTAPQLRIHHRSMLPLCLMRLVSR